MARKATKRIAKKAAAGRTSTRSSAAKRTTARKAAPKKAAGKRAVASGRQSARRSSDGQQGKDLGDLFLETLKDIYHAEKQLLRALPKMAKAAQSDTLRRAFQKHTEETRGHVERVERIFAIAGERPKAKPCHAILGLVEEGEEVMKDFKGSDALDAGLLAAAQAVEHYEMSRYGTLKSWAEQHGMQDVARLLGETLAEEKRTDQLLTEIAEGNVNRMAA
jgi:ferritin-like metal-binding protein YciE